MKNEKFDQLIEARNKKTLLFKTLAKFMEKIGPEYNNIHLYQMADYNLFMASGHFDKFLMSRYKIDINDVTVKELYETENEFIKNSIVKDIDFKDINNYIGDWYGLLSEELKNTDDKFQSRHVPFVTNHLDEAQWCIDTLYRIGDNKNG